MTKQGINDGSVTKLRCVVERITYQNAENGYSVMKVKVKGYNDLVTLVGNLLEVPAGSVLLCEGEWKVDKRYGQQFQCKTWKEVMPATAYGIEKYLGSGLVKGIGPKFAKLIVNQFGTDTIEVIETDIERLFEVPGIGKKRVEKIRESWEKQKDIKNVMLFLQGFGVSTAYAAKIRFFRAIACGCADFSVALSRRCASAPTEKIEYAPCILGLSNLGVLYNFSLQNMKRTLYRVGSAYTTAETGKVR